MRLGGPVRGAFENPGEWVAKAQSLGYRACIVPLNAKTDDAVIAEYVEAAKKADIVFAEVGAWGNPISPDPEVAKKALVKCKTQLELADKAGARCCVNIAGSRSEKWDGPDAKNFTDETFDMIVEYVRDIIDSVKPTRTYYTLETMPWSLPDSADSYVRLLKAIDRKRFAVHLDPVNLVCSPQRYFRTGDLIKECFAKLGPHIRSCHGKDILLSNKLTTHLDEVRPGTGGLDYRTYLKELDALEDDVPLILEHLPNEEEYRKAADYVRGVAKEVGVKL